MVLVVVLGAKINLSGTAAVVAAAAASATVHSAVKLMQVLLFLLCKHKSNTSVFYFCMLALWSFSFLPVGAFFRLFCSPWLAVRLSSFYLLLTFCSLISETVAVVAEVSDGGNCTQRCLGAHLSVSQLRTVAVVMISKLFAEAVSKQKESETLNVKDCLLAASCLADLNDFFSTLVYGIFDPICWTESESKHKCRRKVKHERTHYSYSVLLYLSRNTHTCEQSI